MANCASKDEHDLTAICKTAIAGIGAAPSKFERTQKPPKERRARNQAAHLMKRSAYTPSTPTAESASLIAMLERDPEHVPAALVTEVSSELSTEQLASRLPAISALLRMALLGGMEMSEAAMAELVLDIAEKMVVSDRQLLILAMDDDRLQPGFQVPRHWAQPPPAIAENLLNRWTLAAGKPLLARAGMDEEMDGFLSRQGFRHAVSVPLFSGHGPAGSLQLFRHSEQAFAAADAQLLWLLSLLAETQMAHAQAMQHLLRFAFNDYLTGLKTRRYFEQALEQEVRRAMRRRSSCALLLLDLDDFKQINDRFGHHAGDEVLRQFARLLNRDMREVDTAARFGGDEFAVILPDTDADGARFVATRIREAVRQVRFQLPEAQDLLALHISIGVALCPQHDTSPDGLIRAADLALYKAKTEGKNRFYFGKELRRPG